MKTNEEIKNMMETLSEEEFIAEIRKEINSWNGPQPERFVELFNLLGE